MESTQTIYVSIPSTCTFSRCEGFYYKMTKDGRIQIPKIYLKEQQQTDPNNCLTEVNLKPVEVNFKKAERIERYILPNRL